MTIRSQLHHDRYQRFIAAKVERPRPQGYVERHHIVPVSMGGSDHPSNLIYLTAREHFLAHWMLWKAYRNRAMAAAFSSMRCLSNINLKRDFRMTSRAFESARIATSEASTEYWSAPVNRERQSSVAKMYGLGKAPKTQLQLEASVRRGKAASADPEVLRKRSLSMSQKVWMTKGEINKRVAKEDVDALGSEGWVRGRFIKPDSKARMMKNLDDLKRYGRGGVPK